MVVEKADKTEAGTSVVGEYSRSTLVPLTGSVRLSADDAQIRKHRRPVDPRSVDHMIGIVARPILASDISAQISNEAVRNTLLDA